VAFEIARRGAGDPYFTEHPRAPTESNLSSGISSAETSNHPDIRITKGELVISTVTSGPNDETIRAFLNDGGLPQPLSDRTMKAGNSAIKSARGQTPEEATIPQAVQLL
jgi:hypothetical protein